MPASALKPGPDPHPKPAGPPAISKATPLGPAKRGGRSREASLRLLAIVGLAALALAVRLRDPLSSSILAAEDPYLFMTRTWDLVQGHGVEDYPIGFMLVLAPFTVAGPAGFAQVARFLPALFGVAAVVGTYVLAQRHMRPVAAVAAALLLAVMPEHIVRTNILFPTALILALLPLLFHLLLRLEAGEGRASIPLAALMLFLLLAHPWFVALSLPPLLLFGLARMRSFARLLPRAAGESAPTKLPRWVPAAAMGSVAVALLLVWATSSWLPSLDWAARAFSRLGELIRDPSSIEPLPLHVDLPYMLTVPALMLGAAGAAVALVRHRAFDVLALAWTAALFPFAVVDWFDVWYIPHRTVGFLAIGLALLSGIAVSAVVDGVGTLSTAVRRRARSGDGIPRPFLSSPNSPGPRARPDRGGEGQRYALALGATPGRGLIAVTTLVVVGALAVPSGFATHHWYRIYDGDDYEAWEEVAARDPGLVVTGDWRTKAGYRAMTGGDAILDPDFFWNADRRQMLLNANPDLVVLVDEHARKNQTMEFVHEGWRSLGTWGDNEAFVRGAPTASL